MKNQAKHLFLTATVLWLVLVCLFAWKKPAYNFDMLPYMGIVLIYDGIESPQVLPKVRQRVFDQIPAEAMSRLDDKNNLYRQQMLTNNDKFTQNLAMYAVKPLYTGLCWMFYRANIPLTKSTVLPSIIGYFAICLITFLWLSPVISPMYAFLAAALISLWAPFFSSAGLSTPDTLAAALLLAGLYFFQRGYRWPGFAFLLCAITSRPDAVLPAIVITWLSQPVIPREKNVRHTAIFQTMALLVISALCLCLVSKHGWNVFFFGDFYRHLHSDYAEKDVSVPGYVELFKSQLMTALYYSSVLMFFLLTAIFVILHRKTPAKGVHQRKRLLLTFCAVIVLRFILQPVAADRFYLFYYITALVFLMEAADPKKETTQVAGSRASL